MESVGWWAGLVTVLTAAIAGVRALTPQILQARERRRAERERRELEAKAREAFSSLVTLWRNRQRIKTRLRRAISSSVADRVVVWRSENGGGIPHASGAIYLSVIEEETSDGIPAVKDDWHRRQPTAWYETNVLLPLCSAGYLAIHAREVPDEEPLRRLLAVQAVERLQLYVVGATPERALVYLSIGWRSDTNPTPHDWYVFESLVGELREIYREDEELLTWEDLDQATDRVRARLLAPDATGPA